MTYEHDTPRKSKRVGEPAHPTLRLIGLVGHSDETDPVDAAREHDRVLAQREEEESWHAQSDGA